jgi:DNA-binding transcriptional regulator YiaG
MYHEKVSEQTVQSVQQLIAEKVNEVFVDADMTQEKFAEWIGVSKRIVAYWLKGERTPTVANLLRMAERHGKEVSWFFLEPGQRIENGERTVTPEEALAVITELVDQSDTKPIAIPVKRRAVEKMRSHRNARAKEKADEA